MRKRNRIDSLRRRLRKELQKYIPPGHFEDRINRATGSTDEAILLAVGAGDLIPEHRRWLLEQEVFELVFDSVEADDLDMAGAVVLLNLAWLRIYEHLQVALHLIEADCGGLESAWEAGWNEKIRSAAGDSCPEGWIPLNDLERLADCVAEAENRFRESLSTYTTLLRRYDLGAAELYAQLLDTVPDGGAVPKEIFPEDRSTKVFAGGKVKQGSRLLAQVDAIARAVAVVFDQQGTNPHPLINEAPGKDGFCKLVREALVKLPPDEVQLFYGKGNEFNRNVFNKAWCRFLPEHNEKFEE